MTPRSVLAVGLVLCTAAVALAASASAIRDEATLDEAHGDLLPRDKVDHELTPQETGLLRFLSEGHSYESSAANLNVSVNTVRNYVRSVYAKLHVHSKSEAVTKALRRGILR